MTRHPTPAEAFAALSERDCLYSPVSACSGGTRSAGLRDANDDNVVLVCRAHFGRLRQLTDRELAQLEQHLVVRFYQEPAPAPEREEGAKLVYTRA